MPARDHVIQIQRTLYHRFRSSARRSLGNPSPALRKYFLEYQREFTQYRGICPPSELVQAYLKADLLICGDYHTLPQAQRTVLRLLRESVAVLRRAGRTPVLALEMLRPMDNAATERFLSGELSEKKFLSQVGFERNWGFAWENYRPLFELAKREQLRVVGLNLPGVGKKPSLQQRDRFAAKQLAELFAAVPKASVVTLIGDLHLASNHLPAALEKEWERRKMSRRVVVVHQNPERLYWKLAARGLEHEARVVKLRKDVFCVLNTPPWVKLQSYLRWLDPGARMDRSADYGEDFLELTQIVQRFLGLEGPIDDSFQIRWAGEWSRGASTDASFYSRRFRRLLLREVGSYYDPATGSVYLSTSSVNAAATQAAVFLHAKQSGRWRQFEFPRRDFYPTVWVEALGFLGSKAVNPHRRCYGPLDFQEAAPFDALARIVSSQIRAERAGGFRARFEALSLPSRTSNPERAVLVYRAARCLGQVLGHALYVALASNRLELAEIQDLFRNPFSDAKKARALYLGWVRRLDRLGLRDSIRRDRW